MKYIISTSLLCHLALSAGNVHAMDYVRSWLSLGGTATPTHNQSVDTPKSPVELKLILIGDRNTTESSNKAEQVDKHVQHNQLKRVVHPAEKSVQVDKLVQHNQLKQVVHPAEKSVFRARDPQELSDLFALLQPAYLTTLCLESNGSYPKWYMSDEFFTILEKITTLDTLKLGSTMEMYTMGWIPFAEHLNVSTLRRLTSGHYFFYFDVGLPNLQDLLKLVNRNKDALEAFSFPSGYTIHQNQITQFYSEFPRLPKGRTFSFWGKLFDTELNSMVRILGDNVAYEKINLTGQWTNNQADYEILMDHLSKCANLKNLSLYFEDNNILPGLIKILNAPKTIGIKKLKFSTQWTKEGAYELGKAIGKQPLEVFVMPTIPGDCAADFFRGWLEMGSDNATLTTLSTCSGSDFTDAEGMKAFGDFLNKKPSIQSLVIENLRNFESAQILAECLAKRPVPLTSLQIYYWETKPSIQMLFAPLTGKTNVNIFDI